MYTYVLFSIRFYLYVVVYPYIPYINLTYRKHSVRSEPSYQPNKSRFSGGLLRLCKTQFGAAVTETTFFKTDYEGFFSKVYEFFFDALRLFFFWQARVSPMANAEKTSLSYLLFLR